MSKGHWLVIKQCLQLWTREYVVVTLLVGWGKRRVKWCWNASAISTVRDESFPLPSYEVVSKSFRTESITKQTTTINTRREATQMVMAAELTGLTHIIAIQLQLVAESCTICSSRSRRPVRKLLDTPSYIPSCLTRGSEGSSGSALTFRFHM
jgi:hypothetical protein